MDTAEKLCDTSVGGGRSAARGATMATTVFAAVLLAAMLHAGWNAIIKVRLEPFLSLCLISGACGLFALPFVFFVDFPVEAAWPYILASCAIHFVYYYALGEAYRAGDLGQIYPIARGTAPLLTAIGAHLLVGERIGLVGALGITVLTSGILLLSLKGGRKGVAFDGRSIGFALLTATTISAYTLVDGIGARLSVGAMPYIIWLTLLDGIMMTLYALYRYGTAGFRHPPRTLGLILAGGAMSALAYGIAIWAMTQAPIALVAALRETSVLFAAIIGIVVLREPVMALRLVAGGLVLIGVVLVRMK